MGTYNNKYPICTSRTNESETITVTIITEKKKTNPYC